MSDQLRLGTTRGRGAVLASTVASGMAFLDGTVVNVALPHIGADLHADLAGLQWTVNAYTLALASLVLLGGALGDRYGRRRVFLTGVTWFTVASVLCGLSPGIGVLIAARTVQGMGAALLTPSSLALLQSSFVDKDRARAIGAWSGLSGVATALGPFVGGWLIDALSWRWIFFMNVPLAVVAVLAALAWVPSSRAADRTAPFDILGAVLGALGLAGIVYALIDHGIRAVPAAVVGVLAMAAFGVLEHRRGDRAMLPLTLFTRRQFTVINVVTLFVYAGLGGLTFFLIVELQVVAGFSALLAGVSMLPVTLMLLVGSARAGALSSRTGPRWPLTAGGLIAAGGVLLFQLVGPHTVYWTHVLPGAILLGTGMTLTVAPLTAAVLAAAPTEQAGAASGVSNAVARSGGLLAIAALPLVVGIAGTRYRQPPALDRAFHTALWCCAGLFVTGAVIAGLFARRPPS